MENSTNPRAQYERRLRARLDRAARYRRLEDRLAYARLALAVLGVAMAWLAFVPDLIHALWLAAPVASFVVMVAMHGRILGLRTRAERAAEFYQRGIDRLDGAWHGRGDDGNRYLDPQHPYAGDLDLLGRGSLYELLCAARTLPGQRTLARWLLEPAAPAEIRERQEAIRELRERLDLREDLAILGEDVRRGVHDEALPRWGEAPLILDSLIAQIAAAVLAIFSLGAFVAMFAGRAEPIVFLAALGTTGAFGLYHRRRVLSVAAAVEQPAHDLQILAEVLGRLERETFACARLRRLAESLETSGRPTSKRIARLKRLMELLDSRDHLLMRVIGPPLLWTTQIAFAIEAWRKKTGPRLRRWLDAVGELEALSSLAGYAFEHPQDPFPEIAAGCRCFEAKELGHPLIPEPVCVRNDVELNPECQVLLVSGSNMSGKSTLLRTVGVNAVLAMAGAPVRAASLRLSPLAPGASIRVMDSLQSGVSRFYAEITRIRQLMDLTSSGATLLFLLDELLHGTNSHDRRIGAEAIVRKLVREGALGLVTTHDLAIAHIADELSPRVRNVHFQDHLEDGQMKFDYKLRLGVVEHSNAIELMRSVGLEV